MINLLNFTKEERQDLAEQWLNHLEDSYLEEVEESRKKTYFVPERIALNGLSDNAEYTTFKDPAKIYIVPMDTVSCLFRHKENESDDIPVGVLNFASFKHPGGMFHNGSSAQEEALCHHSTLIYSLMTMTENFYIPHMKKLNYGLYNSDAIISTDITFVDRTLDENKVDDTTKAKVITMAAPNLGTYIRRGYNKYDAMYMHELNNRIVGVLNVASMYDTWDLILGAFGCGVFKNEPENVADLFFDYLTSDTKYNFSHRFRKVFFAIPKSFRNNNYKVFCEVGKTYNVQVLEDY